MERKLGIGLVLFVSSAFFLLPAVINAQPPRRQGPPAGMGGPPPDGGRRPGPPGGPHFDPMWAEMRPDGKVVKGAPYSATAVTESIQTLADGTRITNKTTANVYRDTEGRTRREQTLSFAGPFTVSGDPQELVFINDVIAGVNYVLDVRSRTARKMPLPLNRQEFTPPLADQAKTESLGKQLIEGVEAEGTRVTAVIPTGEIGNDRPLEFVTERWESTELKTAVLIKHKNPRLGEVTYRLTNINRSEPAKSLFEIPSGFSVSEGRSPRGGSPPMQRGRRP